MSENLPQNPEPKNELSLSLRIILYLIAIVIFGLFFFVITPGYIADEIAMDIFLAIFFALNELLKKKKK